MAARRGPKLALAVPTLTIPTPTATMSPFPRASGASSPSSPTVHNTCLNQYGFSAVQPPTFAYSQSSNTKSILKKGQLSKPVAGKKLSFSAEPMIHSIDKLPQEYYGEYVKLSKDERRWSQGV